MRFSPQKRDIRADATKKGAKGILSFLFFIRVNNKTVAIMPPKIRERKKQRRASLYPRKAPIPAANFISPIPIPASFNHKDPREKIAKNIPPPNPIPIRLERDSFVIKLNRNPQIIKP